MGLVGLVVAAALLLLLPQKSLIFSAGYLLFLPFLIHAKGGTGAIVGIGLALLFAGGALGKACCG
jgi:hypothetical protein